MHHALVTGGGNGLGAAIARELARQPAHVSVLDTDVTAAEAVASDLPSGQAIAADVADEGAVEQALDALPSAPDVVVCNAGIVRFGPLLDLAVDDWSSVVETNLTGTFVVARAVARRMVQARRRGAIVNIGSMNGVAPGPNAGAYGATKAAITLLTQQMALEWGEHGIRVNAVAPGMIDAGMSSPIFADPEFRRLRESRVPLGRLGTADDIARAVVWLASSSAEYVTGQTLLVDGGVTMSAIAHLPRPAVVDQVGMPG